MQFSLAFCIAIASQKNKCTTIMLHSMVQQCSYITNKLALITLAIELEILKGNVSCT